MLGAVDLDVRPEHGAGSDTDRRGVQDRAAGVDEDAVAEMEVEAVGAMEGRLDADVAAGRAKQGQEFRADVSALARRQAAMLMDGVHGAAAQRLELGIDAGVPLAGRHLLAFGGHDISVTPETGTIAGPKTSPNRLHNGQKNRIVGTATAMMMSSSGRPRCAATRRIL